MRWIIIRKIEIDNNMNKSFYFINKKLTIILFCLLIVNCILYFLYVKDIDSELNRLREDEQLLNQEVKKAEDEAFRAKALLKDLVMTNMELEEFYYEILGSKEERILKILEQVDSLANRYNLLKRDLIFDHKELEKEKVIQFDIVFPLRGSYSDIRDFINHIEKSTYFLIINRIDLASPDKSEDVITLNVHLRTYFSAVS